MCVCVCTCTCACPVASASVWLFVTPWTVARQAPWDFSGKNIEVGCHSLLQGISWPGGQTPVFLRLLHCHSLLQGILLTRGSPPSSCVSCVAISFSRGSPDPGVKPHLPASPALQEIPYPLSSLRSPEHWLLNKILIQKSWKICLILNC